MASQVYYRFRSQRDYAPIAFDGTGISVWELKKEIIAANNMGKANEFDFSLLDPETDQEYRNDNEIVPRATSVIARRLPARKSGHGTAQNYVVTEGAASAAAASAASGLGGSRVYRGEMSKRFNQPDQETEPPKEQLRLADASMGELERIQAFQQMSKEQWEEDQEKMAHGKRMTVSRGGLAGAPRTFRQPAPNKPVPQGYVCHRCDKPGHWIQDCPTNDDPNFEDKPRVKRTTGIPRSFLTAVESRDAADNVMMTQDGTFVVAKPDMASWEQHRAIAPNLSADDVQNLQPTDPDLTCPICSRLLRNAVTTKCCSTAFCEECIRDSMSKHANACPECESRIKNVAQLLPDDDRRARVAQYVDEMVRVSEEAGKKQENGIDRDAVSEAGEANGESPMPSGDVRSESREPSLAPSLRSNGLGAPSSVAAAAAPAAKPVTAQPAVNTPWQQELAKQQQLFQLMVLLANPKTPAIARAQCQQMLANFNSPGGSGGSLVLPAGPRAAIGLPVRTIGAGRGVNPFGMAPGLLQAPQAAVMGQQPGVTYGVGPAGGGFTRNIEASNASPYMYSAPAHLKRERPADFVHLH